MLPFLSALLKLGAAFVGDGVVAAAGACALVTPVGTDQTALFQTLEGGVQSSLLQTVFLIGQLLDVFVDFITVVVTAGKLC